MCLPLLGVIRAGAITEMDMHMPLQILWSKEETHNTQEINGIIST